MKPRGPLMIEHRLIEKMIEIIRKKISEIEQTRELEPGFIENVVDFIRVYADRTHHGKEEEILFRNCTKKSMSVEDVDLMNELIEEHEYSRKTIEGIELAYKNYEQGQDSLNILLEKLKALTYVYPKHIEKEDKVFFPDSEKYFSEKEQQEMLEEFWEFDKKMIHEKYRAVVDNLKKQ